MYIKVRRSLSLKNEVINKTESIPFTRRKANRIDTFCNDEPLRLHSFYPSSKVIEIMFSKIIHLLNFIADLTKSLANCFYLKENIKFRIRHIFQLTRVFWVEI